MVSKLLVLDDEVMFGQGIKALFSSEIKEGKFDVICAHDGQEALNLIENDNEQEIDLILLDLVMPAGRMDGFTFLNALHEKNIYIKTIIISAHPTLENQRKAIREDVLFFLTKPLPRLQNLKELVEEAFSKPGRFDKNTRKVRFNTLLKSTKELPSPRKERLIYKIAEQLELPEIENLQKKFPIFLERQVNLGQEKQQEVIKEQSEKKSLIEKLRSGEIEINAQTPPELLKGHTIEERYIRRKNGDIHGPYYYLRWQDENNGKTKSRYLGKTDPKLLLP